MMIKIVDDFSDAPGGRYASEGIYSGEEFRVNLLKPAFEEALSKNEFLTVDMDGGYGYMPSFLDEAFGGLAREYSPDIILAHLRIISNDEPGLVDRINEYIRSNKK